VRALAQVASSEEEIGFELSTVKALDVHFATGRLKQRATHAR
jgi:hypothetical protein